MSDAAGTAAGSASSKECLHTEFYQHTVTDIPGHGWGDLWIYELKCTQCHKVLATCRDNDHGVDETIHDEAWAARRAQRR